MIGAAAVHPLPCHTTTRPAAASSAAGGLAAGLQQPGLLLLELGLLPLALQGSGLYSPLAIVIIGGLLTSTLLGRLVTPVMYKLLPPPIVVQPDAKVDASLAVTRAV